MKRKIEKKLTVNKETIANLKTEELNSVKGGAPSLIHPCGTLLTICCQYTVDLACD